jgi:hypothetical protein
MKDIRLTLGDGTLELRPVNTDSSIQEAMTPFRDFKGDATYINFIL